MTDTNNNNNKNKSKALTRREFIKKSLGLAGLAWVLPFPAPQLLKPRKNTTTNPGLSSNSPANQAQPEQKKRAWCMVIDLRKCTGCVNFDTPPQCTQSCINAHFVPKEQQWIQVYEAGLPGGGTYFMPTPCYHCENAPCVNV